MQISREVSSIRNATIQIAAGSILPPMVYLVYFLFQLICCNCCHGNAEWPIPVECNPVGAASTKGVTTLSNKKPSTEETSPREVNSRPSPDRKLDSIVKKEVDELLHDVSVEDLLSESEEDTSDELRGVTVNMILDDDTAPATPTLQELPQQPNDFTLSEREFNIFVAGSDEESC